MKTKPISGPATVPVSTVDTLAEVNATLPVKLDRKGYIYARCRDCHRVAAQQRYDFHRATTLRCACCGGIMESMRYVRAVQKGTGQDKPWVIKGEVAQKPVRLENNYRKRIKVSGIKDGY